MGLFDRFRYAQAFEAGQIEHGVSRILGVALMVVCYMYWTGAPERYIKFGLIVCVVSWWLYIFAHRLEKWLYPGNH